MDINIVVTQKFNEPSQIDFKYLWRQRENSAHQ